jgi:hypothetical protein
VSEEEGLGGELPDPPGGDGEPPVDVGVVRVRRVYKERRVINVYSEVKGYRGLAQIGVFYKLT